jgi:hypothetical protein
VRCCEYANKLSGFIKCGEFVLVGKPLFSQEDVWSVDLFSPFIHVIEYFFSFQLSFILAISQQYVAICYERMPRIQDNQVSFRNM